MKTIWEWQVHCELCGYRSRWHRYWFTQLLSFWHTLRHHPHGYNTVSAAEKKRCVNCGKSLNQYPAKGPNEVCPK